MDENENKLTPELDQESDVAEALEEKDGVKYETNDNWEFDASAPATDSSIKMGDFELDLEPEKEEKVSQPLDKPRKEEPVVESKPNQIVINKDKFKFVPISIFVALCIAVISFLGYRYYTVPNGKEGKYMNPGAVACVIDDTKISVGMYNYYYSSIISYYESYASYGYYDLDTSGDYTKQYTTDKDGNKVTWDEYFRQQALEQIKETTVYYDAGVKAGITLTKAQKEVVDSQIEQLENTALEQDVTVNEYIAANFGQYCSIDTIRLMLEQYYITANYKGKLAADNKITDDEINSYYDEHKDEYYSIKFDYLALEYDAENSAESEKKAKSYMKRLTDEASLVALIPDVYANYIEQDVQSAIEADDKVTEAEARKQSISNYEKNISASITRKDSPFDDATNEWLFNSKTKIGESKYYIDTETNYIYIILKTEEPTIADEETYSVRHILITPEADQAAAGSTDFTDEQMKAAKKEADKVLDLYNKGDKTEYSFALLAEEYSTDTASLSAGSGDMFGGLYEGTPLGQMVPSFEEWATDKSRKYGDTGIVESDYGYHIMFFVNDCEKYKADIIQAIREEKINKLMDDARVKPNDTVIKRAEGITSVPVETVDN